MEGKTRGQGAIESFCGTIARPLRAQGAIELRCGATAGSLLGQGAMEYLVTYGWALLALFAVVAILISSGAFSASNFTVPECTFQPDLPCNSFILYKTSAGISKLQFSLTNGLGFPIHVSNVSYTATDLGTKGRQTYPETIGSARLGTILPGEKMNFTQEFPGIAQPSARDFRTVYVSLTYQNCRSGTCVGNYTTSGRISLPVEQGS